MAMHAVYYKPEPRDVTNDPLPLCYECNRTATRWVRSAQRKFSAPRCYLHMVKVVRILTKQGATDIEVTLIGPKPEGLPPSVVTGTMPDDDRLEVPIPELEGIDLILMARDLLTGALGSHDTSAVEGDGLTDVAARYVEGRIGREMNEREQIYLELACSIARSALREAKRDALLETQQALHSPMMAGVR